MADYAPLGPAPGPALGHFLPYLLRRRLRAVVWPAAGTARTAFLFILALLLIYGAGLGVLLNLGTDNEQIGELLPKLIIGLNATVLFSILLVDFLPALRSVTRPVPEHFPVSARLNALTAFLLDLITLRRLTLAAGLLTALLVAPRHALVPGFALLLLLAATALSFNLRLLVALHRWRHPFMGLHLVSLGFLIGWVSLPELPYRTGWGWVAVLLPWLLGAAQLHQLGPYFSVRFLPDAAFGSPPASGQLLARLSPEWKAYVRKVWRPLLLGLAFKVVMVSVTGLMIKDGKPPQTGFFSVFYFAFLPTISFTYANNNLFGFVRTLVANEVQRLGLTRRVLGLYLRLVGPVVLVDCLLSAVLLLALFPRAHWQLLGLLPLGLLSLSSIGLWGSLYQAKPVVATVDSAALRKNSSTLMSLATAATAVVLYFMPWWWARIALTVLITASAVWPIRAVLRNNGSLRRRLWGGIGA